MTTVQANSNGVTDSLYNKTGKQASLAESENQVNPAKISAASSGYPQNMGAHKAGELMASSSNEESKVRGLGQDVTNTLGIMSNRISNISEAGEKDAP